MRAQSAGCMIVPFVSVCLFMYVMVVVVMICVVIVTFVIVVAFVVAVIVMLGMVLPFMISVIMGFERNAAAVGQQADPLYVLQGQTFGPLRQTAHRLFEPRGQRRTDPDHQIGLGHGARLAGAHGIAVG